MKIRSIRGKLLVAFGAIALGAVAGMAAGGYAVLRARAVAQARATFGLAPDIVNRALAGRFRLLTVIGNLSYIDPVIRQVTGGATDASDFGLESAAGDAENLKVLHDNLVDATWDWAAAANEGTFAVADYKGRVIYAYAASDTWGGDAARLAAVAESLADPRQPTGAMLLGGDDPRLLELGLVRAGTKGLVLVLAHAEVLRGRPRAVFIQVSHAEKILEDAAIGDARVGLLSPGGVSGGGVPHDLAVAAVRGGATLETRHAGHSWMAQAVPLLGPDRAHAIGHVVVAQDMTAALAALIDPALPALAGVSLVLLALALLGAALLASRMSRPVIALDDAAGRVAAGDLEATVPARAGDGDELDRLGRSFNHMLEGLRERERVKTTFKKYLAPDVVDYLLAHPEAQALGGERRELTVMFSDIVEFTRLAEARPPEDVVAILNRYFTRVSERIAARGGTVDKYIGDAVMAFFGAPVPRPDHAARACLAALDHLDVVDELGDVKVRIGINTGDMIVGNIGGAAAQDYTVIGDNVNLAQRVEGANRVYGTRLLVTEAVKRAAGDAVCAREIDRVILPGRLGAVTLFEVLGPAGFFEAHPAHRESARCYADGLAALRALDFTGAAAGFRAALEARQDDAPAATMMARAEAYLTLPPSQDWDGVYRLPTSK